jgi:hypothetical protein
MKYKIILKQIDILEVDAPNEEAAIKAVRDRLDPRSLAEIQVAEETTLDDNT